MENTHFLPPHYRPKLDLYHTQLAIKQAKDDFEDELAALLHLSRVSAPLFVDKATGLNDDRASPCRWCSPWPSGSATRWAAMDTPWARASTRT